jgi:hypothetical protein
MPQLDLYTYFTQFQWLLVVFTLIFILINGNFVPTFQSLFVIRNFIGTLLDSKESTGLSGNTKQGIHGFDFEKGASVQIKKTTQASLTSQWDQIYDKYRVETAKTHGKKSSNKVNESKKSKSGKKITSNKK